MIERLVRIPLIWSLLAMAVAAAWFLRPIDRSALFPVRFSDGASGYVNAEGRVAFAEHWYAAFPFDAEGNAIVRRGHEVIIDRTGRPIAEGEACWPFDKSGLARVRRDNKWGYVDRTGRLVIPTDWDDAYEFGALGLAMVIKHGKRGFVDREGKLAIPAKWDGAGLWWPPSDSSLVCVNRDGKWGYVDRTGRLVIPTEWDFAVDFDESGLAFVRKIGGKYGAIDRTGKLVVAEEWDDVHAFGASELAIVVKGDKYGAIDRTGRIAIAPAWDYLSAFDSSGLAAAGKEGRFGFIDLAGKVVVPIEWANVSEFRCGLAVVADADNSCYVDRAGKIVIPIRWERAYAFHESGVAQIWEKDKTGFIDRTGRLVLPPKFVNGSILGDPGAGVHCIKVWDEHPLDEPWHWLHRLDWLAERLGWELPLRTSFCELYDTDGRLVWSSDGLSERSWMVIAAIAISLLVVVEVGCLVSGRRSGPS